jgi:hypothetical protein
MPFDDARGFRSDEEDPVRQALRAARAVIATPDRWCKGSMYCHSSAGLDRRCLTGAVFGCPGVRGDIRRLAFRALDEAARRRGYHHPITFNDHPATTHADVMALFDEALAGR